MKSQRARLALVGLATLAGCWFAAVFVVLPFVWGVPLAPGHDFKVYYEGAVRFRHGQPLFSAFLQGQPATPMAYEFISPPLFAVMMLPFTLLPQPEAIQAWALLNYALFVPIIVLLARLPGGPEPLVKGAWLMLAMTGSYLPLGTVVHGQTNLLVLLALAAALWCFERARDRAASLWLTFGLHVKLVTLAPLLVLARWRPRSMLAPLLGISLAVLVAMPYQHWLFARALRWVMTRDRLAPHNQSPQAFVKRFLMQDPVVSAAPEYAPWLDRPELAKALAALLALALLTLTLRALLPRPRNRDEMRLAFSLMILALLVTPRITEFHHMTWSLISLAVLGMHVAERCAGRARTLLLSSLPLAWIAVSFSPFTPGIDHLVRPLLFTRLGPLVAGYSALGLLWLFGLNWWLLLRAQREPCATLHLRAANVRERTLQTL